MRCNYSVAEGIGSISGGRLLSRPDLAVIILAIALAVGCQTDSLGSEASGPQIADVGPMVQVRSNHTATPLSDTTILFLGGGVSACSAEIYTLRRRSRLIRDGSVCRIGHTATMLQDGTILIVGGTSSLDLSAETLASAEIYSPIAGGFTPTGDLANGRFGHEATLLGDATVLITGGYTEDADGNRRSTPSAELYDPQLGEFIPAPDMNVPRVGHPTTLLADDSVLLIGGTSERPSAEVYEPSLKRFRPVKETGLTRFHHTASWMSDGRVLILGGVDENARTLADAAFFDPATESFSAAGMMRVARVGHTASVLQDGRVLIAGGNGADRWALASIEIYDPSADVFSIVFLLSKSRVSHTATTVDAGGGVLIAGGWGPLKPGGPTVLRDAELFTMGSSPR